MAAQVGEINEAAAAKGLAAGSDIAYPPLSLHVMPSKRQFLK